MAKKATLLAQDVFWQDCRGWQQLFDACREALVGDVGCLKAFAGQKLCLYEHEQVDPDPLLLMALNATPDIAVADPEQREDGSVAYPVKKYQVEQELIIETVPAAIWCSTMLPTPCLPPDRRAHGAPTRRPGGDGARPRGCGRAEGRQPQRLLRGPAVAAEPRG